jgi:hypothetical protein
MQIQKALNIVFVQLSDSIDQLSQEQYIMPCKNLSDQSIGQHVRHIIEMFQCLDAGYESGYVDYDKRKRDRKIENDKASARNLLPDVFGRLNRNNKLLFLQTYYDDPSVPELIESNYFREVAYNLEHTIHHMALIRIGISEVGRFPLEDSYGVAFSTVKHRGQCAP